MDEGLTIRINADIAPLRQAMAEATRAIGALSKIRTDDKSIVDLTMSAMSARRAFSRLGEMSKISKAFTTGNLDNYKEALDALDQILKDDHQALQALEIAQERAKKEFGDSSDPVRKYATAIASLQSEINGVTSAINEMRNALSPNAGSNASASSSVDKVSTSVDAVGNSAGTASKEVDKLSQSESKLSTTSEKTGKSQHKLASTIGKMLLYRAIRSILTAINTALKEGVQNLYAWDQAHNGMYGVVQTMDAYQSTITKLKNSIAAALYPVLQSLLPIFQQICAWIITAINYVNMFLSLLTGLTTYKRAKDVNDKYANSIRGVGSAAAKATKDLMGFDEINRLSGKTSSGGGGSTGYAYDINDAFEEVAIDEKFKQSAGEIISFINEQLIPTIEKVWPILEPILTAVWQIIENIANSDALKVAGDLLEDVGALFQSKSGGQYLQNVLQLLWDILKGPLYGITIVFDSLFGTNYTGKLRAFFKSFEDGVKGLVNTEKAMTAADTATKKIKESFKNANKAVLDYSNSMKTSADKAKALKIITEALNDIDAQQRNLLTLLTIAQGNQTKAQQELAAAQKEADELGVKTTERLQAAKIAYADATSVVNGYETAIVENNKMAQELSQTYAGLNAELNGLPRHKAVDIDINISKTREQIRQVFPKKVRIPITFVSNTQGIHLSEVNSQISQAIFWGAKGGILDGATLIGAGEAGKEALLPLDRNTGWMDMLADRIASRNQHIQINMDGKAIYDVVVGRNNNIVRQTGSSPLMV